MFKLTIAISSETDRNEKRIVRKKNDSIKSRKFLNPLGTSMSANAKPIVSH